MEKFTQCSYCCRLNYSPSIQSPSNCSCKICQFCIDFLVKSNFDLCPFCKTSIVQPSDPKSLTEEKISQSLENQSKTLEFQLFKKNLKNLEKRMKKYLIQSKFKKFTKKINERFIEINYFSLSPTELLQNLKEFELFTLQGLKHDSILKFSSFYYNNNEEKIFSRLALFREKRLLIERECPVFLGDLISLITVKKGLCNNKINILSGGPCLLRGLGIGISPGKDSSFFLFDIKIFEDSNLVYFDSPSVEIKNRNQRLTHEIMIKKRVLLKAGTSYSFEFNYSGEKYYSLMYSSKVEMNIGDMKVKHEDEEYLYPGIIFYLKTSKIN